MTTIERLSDVAGARITGLDLSRVLTDEGFAQVERALDDHCFVVFPQQTLAPQQFVAFARRWGPRGTDGTIDIGCRRK